MNLFGYVRVSDASQKEDRQMISMEEQGVPAKNIYIDKQSGKDFDRTAYKKLIRRLRPGDCVVLSSLDRLGRDYASILEQWQFITKEKGADIFVLDMPLLDTREKNLDLTGRLISDIVLQLLSYCSQKERESIRQRQAEGIAAAKKRGVKFGRPVREAPGDFGDIVRRWEEKELTFEETLKLCNLSRATFYRRLYEFNLVKENNK